MTAPQSQTAAATAPTGIEHRVGFLAPREADALRVRCLEELRWSSPEVRVFGRRHRVPRRLAFVAGASLRYSYSGLTHVGEGLPAWLAPVVDRVSEAAAAPFDAILATHYRDGSDRLGWHSDAEPELGADPVVAILSLGGLRTLSFRHRDPERRARPGGRWRVALGHGDLLVMAAGVQRDWEHAVPSRARADARISLGFRVLGTRKPEGGGS